MISSSEAKRQLEQVNEKFERMKEALQESQEEYEHLSLRHAEQVAQHLGKKRQPASLRSQEKSLDILRNKVASLEHSILVYEGKQLKAEKTLQLANVHESQAKAFLESEGKFSATAQALVGATDQLRQTIDAFTKLIHQFVSQSNAPIETLTAMLTELDGVSVQHFVRQGEIEEAEEGQNEEFLQNIRATYRQIADSLDLLDADMLSDLEHSCQTLNGWLSFVRNANWTDVIRKGTIYAPRQRAKPGIEQIQPAITTQVVRMPLAPAVDNDRKQRLEEIARHRRMMQANVINANKVINSDA